MNPFTQLGIANSAVRGLSDEQIYSVVKAMHRALALLHHPDRGGKPARFRALQEALEELDYEANPAQFQYWREQLLKSPRRQQADARSLQASAETQQRTAEDCLARFWEALSPSCTAPDGSLSIFRLPDRKIILSETLVNTLIRRQNPASFVLDKFDSRYELELRGGECRRFELQRRKFDRKKKESPPSFKRGWGYDGKSGDPHVWERTGSKGALLPITIIGGIPPEALLAQPQGSRGLSPLLAGYQDAQRDLPATRGGFDWDTFRPFAGLVEPWIAIGHEVITVTYDQPRRFLPIGRIEGMCDLNVCPVG